LAHIKEIVVGAKRLVNLGNYENVTYECTVTVDVDGIAGMDNETLATQAYEEGLKFVKDKLNAEVDRLEELLEKRKK
jgi:hypothetical protein